MGKKYAFKLISLVKKLRSSQNKTIGKMGKLKEEAEVGIEKAKWLGIDPMELNKTSKGMALNAKYFELAKINFKRNMQIQKFSKLAQSIARKEKIELPRASATKHGLEGAGPKKWITTRFGRKILVSSKKATMKLKGRLKKGAK